MQGGKVRWHRPIEPTPVWNFTSHEPIQHTEVALAELNLQQRRTPPVGIVVGIVRRKIATQDRLCDAGKTEPFKNTDRLIVPTRSESMVGVKQEGVLLTIPSVL